MKTNRLIPRPALRALLLLLTTTLLLSAPDAFARQATLLQPSAGQVPTDMGSDDMTKLSIVDNAELGGKALKVERFSGDSFGDRITKVTNWKPFVTLNLTALNPGKSPVKLVLTAKHRRSTSYQTRVDVPFTLKPGINKIKLGIDEMVNVNASTPDLEHVTRWYIACEGSALPAVFFGDIVLDGADDPVATTSGKGGGPAASYRITGTVGGSPVELIAEPIPNTNTSARVPVETDPARLARIRAAKMPPVTKPVMFDTPEADAIVSALEVFPPDHPINQTVENWPVHPNSDAIVASVGADKPFRYNPDMGFILVPTGQPKIDVSLTAYAAESDPG